MTVLSPPHPRPRPTPRRQRWPEFTLDQILAWADAHHAQTGEWPTGASGMVLHAPREKWANVDAALRLGLRGLEGGSSLARLLDRERGVRNRKDLPRWTVLQILEWADAHHARTGEWPRRDTGAIYESPQDTWMAVEIALSKGRRGLRGGSSLAKLLDKQRNVRNRADLPLLTEPQILEWADAYFARTGRWPVVDAGPIPDAPEVSWCAVNHALSRGTRGLPGGSSLAGLLEERRGVRNRLNQPPLSIEQILAWADAHHQRTGRWPTSGSGPVHETPQERWSAIAACLIQGSRGLPGGESLPRLLARERSARKQGKKVRVLTVAQVLAWADAHHRETGRWPTKSSGPIIGTNETWNGIHIALMRGLRGFPGGMTLAQLLARRRGAPCLADRLPLTEERVLAWADAYVVEHGRWPTTTSGPVAGAAGESWNGVNKALTLGRRGLPGGSSLAQLLQARRDVSKERPLRPLTIAQLLRWIDAHHARTGQWPTFRSGPILEAPGENWAAIDQALKLGYRGLPAGHTLLRFLAEHRGVPHPKERPDLSEAQILAWADAHHARHGRWPRVRDGAIEEAPGENWLAMENALRLGLRGLPGGSSLHKLIRARRSGYFS